MNQQPTKPPKKQQQNFDERFQLLLTLLTLLKDARHKRSKTELEFLLVNQTYNLVPYRHCVYWEKQGDKIVIRTASGLVQVDQDGPYVQWLKKSIGPMLAASADRIKGSEDAPPGFAAVVPVRREDLGADEADAWGKWVAVHAALLVMKGPQGTVRAGLWLDREGPFDELEVALLEDLGDGYADIIRRFDEDPQTRAQRGWKALLAPSKWKGRLLMLALAVLALWPVHLSVTAPAEVVATEPLVVSVPLDGTIDEVEVLPGQAVKEGDVLLRMDSTTLRNRAELAQNEMLAAEIALRKTEREALGDRAKLAEIAILKAQLQQKAADQAYAQELLARAEVKAPRDGIVVFADPNALRGKPARTGEQAMLLTDPVKSELLIRIPVDSMIDIDTDIPARFFLSVAPLSSHHAAYKSIGYQATIDPDGLMTYKVRAAFIDSDRPPRIGWTGTGKVYGEPTILALNLLHRPLVTLRRKLGI